MKQLKRIPITRAGYEKLKSDYEELKSKRPHAVETLSDARRLGDLSENGLYTAAKARLRSIDSQLFRLSMQIKLADIHEGGGDIIRVGSKVLVSDGKRERIFEIVGDYEANPLNDKISTRSPIGKGLVNKRAGDSIIVRTPNGSVSYKILKVI